MENPYQPQIDDLSSRLVKTKQLLTDPEMAELAQLEIVELENQISQLENAAEQAQNTGSTEQAVSTTKTNCIIEIRPGTGGDEAKIWANDLARMYVRFAEFHNLRVAFIDNLVLKLSGKSVLGNDDEIDSPKLSTYEIFRYESGTHRVQRVPETEAQGRIHTSTASVAVLPEVSNTAVEVRDDDLEWQFMRSSGAGGQSVNKTNSAVRLTHKPSGIVVTARTERKQTQNREIALGLLRSQLWEVEEEKREKALGSARSVIGRAQRAEKIRTYNFPQNRITDHRTKQSWHNLPEMLNGSIDRMLHDLQKAFNQESDSSSSSEN